MLLFLITFGIYCWACDTYYIDGKLVNVKKLEEKQAIERRKAEKEIREGSYYAPLMPEYDIPVEKDTGNWTFYQDMIGDTDDCLFR